MTRILHILTDSALGGAGRYLLNYLTYADRERFELRVVLPRDSVLVPMVRDLGVPVIEADGIADRSYDRQAVRTFREIIRSEKPDVVHTHGSLSGRIAGKQCGAKVIYTRHCAFPVPGYLRRGPGRWLYSVLDRRYADHVIAVSPAAEENLLDMGISKSRITVMMNGAAPLQRSSPERQRVLRRELGIPENVFTAGILARLEAYKGQELLLEAARALRQEGREFRFLICGEGSREALLRQRIREWELEDRVLFLGFVEKVEEILSILDLQVNCSYGTETSSLSIIEGMSIGLPAVVSDYGGNPWLIGDGVTGLLFKSRDSADLAAKLRRMMDEPVLRGTLGQNAYEAYTARFSGEIFAGNIEGVYDTVMK